VEERIARSENPPNHSSDGSRLDRPIFILANADGIFLAFCSFKD